MSTPNPLVPQGSLQGQPKGKSNVRIAVFTILAIHAVLVCGLLIQGCKKDTAPTTTTEVEPTNSPAPEEIPPFTNDTTAGLPTDPNALPPVNGTATGATANVSTGATAPTQLTTPATNAGITPTDPTLGTNPTLTQPQPPVNNEPVAPAGETAVHVVAKGDMLSTIAKKYRVSVRSIEEANPGLNPTRLQIGQKINIPAGAATAPTATTSTGAADTAAEATGSTTTYTVKSGDVLERIAKNHGTTVKAIRAANGLKTDRITVGQKLKIPAKQ